MKKGKKNIVIAMGITGCVFMLYIAGYIRINSRFPHEKTEIVEMGDTYKDGKLAYQVRSGMLMTGKEITDKYGDKDVESDFIYMVVWFDVTNYSDEPYKVEVMDMTGEKNTWANGTEYDLLWYLNGDDFDAMAVPGEVTQIGVAFIVNTDLKVLEESSDSWRVQIAGWPNRCDMKVDVKQSVGVQSL